MKNQHSLFTLAVHAGEERRGKFAPVATPIVQTSTFVFPSSREVQRFSEGKSKAFMYTRYGNPTLQAAEVKMAALEGGEAAQVDRRFPGLPENLSELPEIGGTGSTKHCAAEAAQPREKSGVNPPAIQEVSFCPFTGIPP